MEMKLENFTIGCLFLLSLSLGDSGNSINVIELKNRCNPERSAEKVIIPFSNSFKQIDYECNHEYGYDGFFATFKDNENRILETKVSFLVKDRDPLKNEKIYYWLSFEHDIFRKNTYIIKKNITFEPNQTMTSIYAVDRFDVDSITMVSTNVQRRKDGSLVSCELTHSFKKEDGFEKKIIELGDVYSELRIK